MLDPLLTLPGPRLFEVHEIAFLLKCSQETVRRFIRRGQLPAILIGSHWRIAPADYQTFLDAQRAVSQLFAGDQSDRRTAPRPPADVIPLKERVIDQLLDEASATLASTALKTGRLKPLKKVVG